MNQFNFSHDTLLEFTGAYPASQPQTAQDYPSFATPQPNQQPQTQTQSQLQTHSHHTHDHNLPQHQQQISEHLASRSIQPALAQTHRHPQPDPSIWLPYPFDPASMARFTQSSVHDNKSQARDHGHSQHQQDRGQSSHSSIHNSSAQSQASIRSLDHHVNSSIAMPSGNLDLDYTAVMPADWSFQVQQHHHHHQQNHIGQLQQLSQVTTIPTTLSNADMSLNVFSAYNALQPPIEFTSASANDAFDATAGMPTNSYISMAGPMESMNALVYPLSDYQTTASPLTLALDQAALAQNVLGQQHARDVARSSMAGSSPTGTIFEIQSVSDHEWSMVNYNPNRHSMDSLSGTVSNPSQNLHIRTHSDSASSDALHSCDLSGSYEEIPPWPMSSPHDFHGSEYLDAQYLQTHGLPVTCQVPNPSPASSLAVSPVAHPSSRVVASSSSTSPTSSGPTSPPLRRRKSPVEGGKTTKAVIKKSVNTNRKDAPSEKKVGRRRGPLRPDQRQQAHEIRKLRACLRCKFLKKTCDKGEPCAGCRPSHARLWQVPCTRLDIKDIGGFMKDWTADYDRHVSFGFSVGNIKGFSSVERTLYITHGYGHYLPISAREVYVNDDRCFNIDWVEESEEGMYEFEMNTSKLSAGIEGVSLNLLSDYLDRHLDQTFESFVDNYFQGTKFLTEILKTAYRYYQKEKTPAVRKALRLVLAYNLTLHITLVEGLPSEEDGGNVIDDAQSRFYGKVPAPVMINFQVKAALSNMWRELQKDILEELSALYSSVYSGEKLKNWPTIFMLAAILLAVWEEMQFDCHYRVPDEKAVNQFCEDMESTPVGVIIGLFQAISTKLPGLQEWDTKKHHHVLNSNPNICDALSELREHVNKHESYLRERPSAKFDRDDFDCLSGKFLSRLVIRAN